MTHLFYNDKVSVLRPPTAPNRAGEQVFDYSELRAAEGVDREGVQVRAVAQDEVIGEDRETAISEWMLQTEPGSPDWDIQSTDWVRLPDGTVATVHGDPARAKNPISHSFSHLQVRVRRAR